MGLLSMASTPRGLSCDPSSVVSLVNKVLRAGTPEAELLPENWSLDTWGQFRDACGPPLFPSTLCSKHVLRHPFLSEVLHTEHSLYLSILSLLWFKIFFQFKLLLPFFHFDVCLLVCILMFYMCGCTSMWVSLHGEVYLRLVSGIIFNFPFTSFNKAEFLNKLQSSSVQLISLFGLLWVRGIFCLHLWALILHGQFHEFWGVWILILMLAQVLNHWAISPVTCGCGCTCAVCTCTSQGQLCRIGYVSTFM